MKKYVLGLDIGISSVGWGIIDVTNSSVIDAGVRLFAEGTSSLNEERRSFRSARRLKRRRQHRITRIKNILMKSGLISNDFKSLDNPYEIRKKGLNLKLTNDELATAILHIAKRRGLSGEWTVADDEKEAKDDEKTKGILKSNHQLLKDKYICEIQLDRLNHGAVRGHENFFTTDDYVKELMAIFNNQHLEEEIKQSIIKIISDRREYFEGPGSEKSPTMYGRFRIDNGQLITVDLIDIMRGKCSIYPSEPRAAKMSYTADLFNLLNDLNNLEVDGEKITKEEKLHIINKINTDGKITIAGLCKLLDTKKEKINGFRINTKNEPMITEFKGYSKVFKYVTEHNLNQMIINDKDLFDEIIEILTNKKGINERIKALSDLENISLDDANKLAQLNGITGYHSLSLKVMKEVIPDLIETSNNQMQVFQLNGYFEKNKISYKGMKNIPFNNELILSAVAKRSQAEAIKIINAVRKKYGELDSIIVEMARDKNGEEKTKRIRKEQANGEKISKEIEELLDGKIVSSTIKQKIRHYKEQDGKCLYTAEDLDLNILLTDPTAYEIDHIIPLSISFDDSFNNKVLVKRKANQEKGQRTPYQYFMTKDKTTWTYEKFKEHILSLNISKRKKANFLYEKDINRLEIRKEFINRNLVDTRYASKGVLNTLQNYFKDNEINTKVHTIKGSLTSIFRKKAQIEKDRDIDYKHHAIDALIVAGIKKMNYMDQLMQVSLDIKTNITFDKETGEVITLENEKDFFDPKFINFIKSLREYNNVKYSHKVDRKYNRAVSDQTIYSTRNVDGEDFVVKKYSNIYDVDGEKVAKLFNEGKAEKLLMHKHDPESYDLLSAIVKQYPKEKNPFLKFKEEHGDYIRKKSKKGNGPIIQSLKYSDSKLVSHISISHKYAESKNKKIVLLSINPFRIDVYKDIDGIYKFLKINHFDLKHSNKKTYIDTNSYLIEKERRKISDKAQFLFSLNKGDLFYYNKEDTKREIVRYNGTNYNANKIEYKPLNNNGEEQQYLTIGKQINEIYKINTDILGNLYKAENESCKFEF